MYLQIRNLLLLSFLASSACA